MITFKLFWISSHACVQDKPVIAIDGAEEAICGSKKRFEVENKPAKPQELSVNWQRNKTGATEAQKKCHGSNSRQLAIMSVNKEDKGTYQTFLSQGSNGNIYKIFSNGIYLSPKSTMFCCKSFKYWLGKKLKMYIIWNLQEKKD